MTASTLSNGPRLRFGLTSPTANCLLPTPFFHRFLFGLRLATIILAGLLLVSAGCSAWKPSSKLAMSDASYALKYGAPYPEENEEKYQRMAKQMVDARHVASKSGYYLGVGGGFNHGGSGGVGGEIGVFSYPASWFEMRAGLQGLITANGEDSGAFGGVTGGVRVQPPSRVAPFVGVGGFAGVHSYETNGEFNEIDDDEDFSIDEPGEMEEKTKSFLAVYPEVGVHAWLNGHVRATASASYFVSTEGRDADFWYFGGALAIIPGYDGPKKYRGYSYIRPSRASPESASPESAVPFPANADSPIEEGAPSGSPPFADPNLSRLPQVE